MSKSLGFNEILEEKSLYAVFDYKSECFSNLIPSENAEVLKRQLQLQIKNQPTSVMAQYPNDFVLYKLGSWCPRTGFMVSDLTFVCELSEVLDEGGEL